VLKTAIHRGHDRILNQTVKAIQNVLLFTQIRIVMTTAVWLLQIIFFSPENTTQKCFFQLLVL